jgi:adenylate kinase family enzyme
MIIILGPTGAGKSSQAQILAAREPGYVWISTGEIMRQNEDHQLQSQLKTGRLVDDKIVVAAVKTAIERLSDKQVPILDGFPRRMSQVKLFIKQADSLQRSIEHVFVISVSEATSLKRLAGRNRADDMEETIRTRLAVYETETLEAVEFFRHKGLVSDIDGEGSKEAVAEQIEKVLNEAQDR